MKVALVTGGTGGIGSVICKNLHSHGYTVLVCYNKKSEYAESLAKEIGGYAYKLDVTDVDNIELVISDIKKRFKKIDCLINNAGVALPIKTVLDTTEQEFDKVFSVNVKGVYSLTKRIIPLMLEHGGNIVNVSSMWGISGGACEVIYSASKSALLGFTTALAKEYASANIRVNNVCAGFIDTDMNKAITGKDREDAISQIPLGRIGTPEEVAKAVYYLLEDATFSTGISINLSGGEII